jgi:hypothetical protein
VNAIKAIGKNVMPQESFKSRCPAFIESAVEVRSREARKGVSSLSKIKNILKKSKWARNCWGTISRWFIAMVYTVSPVILARLRFRAMRGKWPNFKSPQSFDEKLIWLMLYWRHPLKTECGDKYTMRAYVKKHGLGHILPDLLGVYKHSHEIDFEGLPKRFVLKCSHGCRFIIICKDKSELKVEETRRQLDAWMKTDFSKAYGEVHYASMKPRIICERFFGDSSGVLPCDYKVYCFDGKAHCVLACTERVLNGKAKYDVYDREWRNKLPYSRSSLLANRTISKP